MKAIEEDDDLQTRPMLVVPAMLPAAAGEERTDVQGMPLLRQDSSSPVASPVPPSFASALSSLLSDL